MARRGLRLLPLSVLIGCCLYALAFWALEAWGDVPPEDTRRASESVRAGWEDGDAFAIRPWWAARAREFLGDLDFVAARDLASEDLSRFRRLWVLSLPGSAELGGPFADGRAMRLSDKCFGRVRVQRFALGEPRRVLFDLRARLHEAEVRIHTRSGPRPCTRWVEDRWICSREHWAYVGQVVIELGTDPREVIWAHPIADGPTEITYPSVPGGSSLVIFTGLTPSAARVSDGATVEMSVELDGRKLTTIVQANETGFFRHEIDIRAFGPGPHQLSLRIRTARIGMRHFCFTGEVRP